jgi:hypothetical protein
LTNRRKGIRSFLGGAGINTVFDSLVTEGTFNHFVSGTFAAT